MHFIGTVGRMYICVMSNSNQLYLLNEHGELSFLLHILNHYIVGNKQGKFKENLMSTFICRESP